MLLERSNCFGVNLGDLYTESGQTLQGSFSAVSKPNFARKYGENMRLKALAEIYTMHSFALLCMK